jgi:hypothetical protein
MSLKPSLIEAVPSETVRVARAAFPRETRTKPCEQPFGQTHRRIRHLT